MAPCRASTRFPAVAHSTRAVHVASRPAIRNVPHCFARQIISPLAGCMTPSVQADGVRPLVALHGVGRDFDVSKPWLNRVLEHAPRQLLTAVDDFSLEVRSGETVAL